MIVTIVYNIVGYANEWKISYYNFLISEQFQALIQMAGQIATETAKLSLDGMNIYTNCCTLRIDYSKLSCLNVKYNNSKSRDYTRQDLPAGDPGDMAIMSK